jgi:hypothetical protein
MGVHHTRKVNLNLSYDEAYKACVESIHQIKKSKIVKEDPINGTVDAKAGISWKTFGDKISFKLKRLENDHTEVEFSSRPIIRTTLIDYGKNLRNVQIIENYLKNL